MLRCTPLLLFFISATFLQAQSKYEKEDRIDAQEVPQLARSFVEELGFTDKIKWYIEEGLNKISYEAKTKQHSKKYSVEFSKDGVIEDIEIKINKKEVDPAVWDKITTYLKATYDKYKVCKIQKQYTGAERELIKSVRQNHRTTGTTLKYEIEIKGKKDGEYQMVEFLFDEGGHPLQQAIIIQKNTDHLEY